MALTRRSISPDDKHIILFDCSEQLLQTARIVNHLILNQWHSLSRVFKDAGEACLQIFKSGENRKGFPFVDTLADVTPLVLSNNELLIEIQAMYFSVTIFLMALTLGQIVGNLWTEFAWAPQMAVHQALIVILLLPLQLSVERLHETIKQRRSELFIKIFFIGFSMGRLCDYNLMLNSPKIICPMVFSILVDNSSGKQEETRLELFINLALIVNGLVCFLLLLNARITFFCFVLSFICIGINLKILFMHFQLFYYGLTQINREKVQKPIWCVSNPWLANADIVYVFCVLAFDVLISVI